jgi:phosphoribosylglycinamide formyltransferase
MASQTSSTPTSVTVLISGSGTNLQALIDACASGDLPSTRIIRVISNRKDAYGLKRAEAAKIPTLYHNLVAGGYYKTEDSKAVKVAARPKYDADLAEIILKDKLTDIVVCAGWMHVLSPSFLERMAAAKVPVINLHPALPEKYNGVGAIERAFDDFQAGKLENNTTGVMVV